MKGYIQIYTGQGKGKTTAAIGLAIRAAGAGKRVLFLQFMKSNVYHEQPILASIPNITLQTVGKPFFIIPEGLKDKKELETWGNDVVTFPKGHPPVSYIHLIEKGLNLAKSAISSDNYDVIILDEFCVALLFNLITREQAEDLLSLKSPSLELVFTGRGAPDWLIDKADLVTNMQEIKHYYTKGVLARDGIER